MPSPADVIASPSNPRIKAAARLRDRRQRDATKLTLVDGVREVRRALDSGVDVVEAFVCEPLLAGEDARAAIDALAERDIQATRTTQAAFTKIALPRADGIVAVIRIPSLLLDGLTPPGRTRSSSSKASRSRQPRRRAPERGRREGRRPVGIPAHRPDEPERDPRPGTIFSVPIAAAPTPRSSMAPPGTSGSARVDADSLYTDADLTGPLALVFGIRDGLTDAWRADDIAAVRLPMHGVADSLNVLGRTPDRPLRSATVRTPCGRH